MLEELAVTLETLRKRNELSVYEPRSFSLDLF